MYFYFVIIYIMENSEIFNKDNARNIFLLIILNYTLISRNYIGDLLSETQVKFWKNNIWAKIKKITN